jgi:hypothetical protein
MERYFQISFHALILTAFVALAETGRIDVGSIVLFLVFFGMTTSRALKGQPLLLTARGDVYRDVVTRLFYRVPALTTPRAGARLPHQTWREWTGKLPDEKRKHLVAAALNIFEKARYSSSPVTPEEYINLEQTIQQLKSA